MSISQDVPDWGGPAIAGSGVTLLDYPLVVPAGGSAATPILYCGSSPALLLGVTQSTAENVSWTITFWADPLGATPAILTRGFVKASTTITSFPIPVLAPFFQISAVDNGASGTTAAINATYSTFSTPGWGALIGARFLQNVCNSVGASGSSTVTPSQYGPFKAWVYFQGQATSTVVMQLLTPTGFVQYIVLPCAANVFTMQEVILPTSEWNIVATNNGAASVSFHLYLVSEQ